MFAVINCRLHIFHFYLGSQVIEAQALGVERKTGTQGPCVRGRLDWRAGPFPSGVLPSSAGRSGRATPSSELGCQQGWGELFLAVLSRRHLAKLAPGPTEALASWTRESPRRGQQKLCSPAPAFGVLPQSCAICLSSAFYFPCTRVPQLGGPLPAGQPQMQDRERQSEWLSAGL